MRSSCEPAYRSSPRSLDPVSPFAMKKLMPRASSSLDWKRSAMVLPWDGARLIDQFGVPRSGSRARSHWRALLETGIAGIVGRVG